MTAETGKTAGAVSQRETNWNAIDWQKVSENVRRLQAPRDRPSALLPLRGAHSPA